MFCNFEPVILKLQRGMQIKLCHQRINKVLTLLTQFFREKLREKFN